MIDNTTTEKIKAVIRTEGFAGLFAKAQALFGIAVAAEIKSLVKQGEIQKLEEIRRHLRHIETVTRTLEGAIRTDTGQGLSGLMHTAALVEPLDGWVVSLIWSYGDLLCYFGALKDRNEAFARLMRASDQYARIRGNQGILGTLFGMASKTGL